MSKILGHKVQLALAVLKARRIELDTLLDLKWWDQSLYQQIEKRIASIDKQIEEINERINKK